MKKDYLKYLEVDPFGDFALIFAAIKHNLKVVEIPVRYREREYGSTNIRRFYHGLLLFKLAWIALKEFKF
ncbi:MAG: type 12 methyltransferase [Candidatus Woesebacteria bacterium GW2011_GWC2_40_30]|nr:MAG: type 12 methyltransferase [Candidatus Woesebacteria bacterium GW2011_GWC2_40_30]